MERVDCLSVSCDEEKGLYWSVHCKYFVILSCFSCTFEKLVFITLFVLLF